MASKGENLVLTGFGDHDLKDMIDWIGDPEKEEDLLLAPEKLIPRYRRQEICTQEEMLAFAEYAGWLNELITAYNEYKEKEK